MLERVAIISRESSRKTPLRRRCQPRPRLHTLKKNRHAIVAKSLRHPDAIASVDLVRRQCVGYGLADRFDGSPSRQQAQVEDWRTVGPTYRHGAFSSIVSIASTSVPPFESCYRSV